ncbi:hydrogen peroxide-inducible genes activator [Kordiimonas marina]|uniref:hydrogen peroxide-inducible genes activator n=1 Tax=Kordiimonas marina TaxID=2872312 RepID=UPI001FF4FA5F|nr:hydrogen peroxide-inducible genes activator [Kordiimonas marina]MCJ9428531.1 hydrogen peroxide-inducible genes activator [Kordiimonas marina]
MSFPPTLKQLRYLVALHKTMHFGKAADQCHVTQSTLSAGLQELENLLGAQLVERTKRSVMFTALGEEVVRRAQTILNDVDDLTDMASAAKDPLKGIVRLGIIPTIAPFLLPRVMPAIRTELPDLELHLREDKSAELCDQLRVGELDLVLFALPFACGDVVEMPLFHDPFMVAYPHGQAPAETVKSTELDENKLLLLEEGHCLRDHALAACHLLGRSAPRALAGTSLGTIIQMVAAGHGITLLPGMAVDAGLAEGAGVDVVTFKDIVPTRTIGLIWRKTNPRAETFKKLGEVIKSVMHH